MVGSSLETAMNFVNSVDYVNVDNKDSFEVGFHLNGDCIIPTYLSIRPIVHIFQRP